MDQQGSEFDRNQSEAPKHNHSSGSICAACAVELQRELRLNDPNRVRYVDEFLSKNKDAQSSSHCDKLPESYAEAEITFKDGNSLKTIKAKRQRQYNDCGSTALEMLGYSRDQIDHYVLQGEVRELNTHDVVIRAGGTWIEKGSLADYTSPHLQLLDINEGQSRHWIVRVKDSQDNDWILCPTYGAVRAGEYEQRTKSDILFQFKVPSKLPASSIALAAAA